MLEAPAPTDPMLGRVVDGRYRLLRALERGGSGTIYVAEQMSVGRQVAVKVLRSSLVDEAKVARRFEREAEIISGLQHEHTLRLFDFGWLDDGRPFLVTELLEGETLGQRLERGRLATGEAVSICCDILAALQEAHDLGIVHRDLKPSNVFLQDGENGVRVRVLDFGIARKAASTTLTEPGMIMGTPAYMSPEQSLKDSIDGRSDLYGVGAILFECLTGRPPFLADSAQTLILKHALMQAPRLNQVSHGFPLALDELVASMLSKTPELRPQTAKEALQALEPFASLSGVAPAGLRDPSFESNYAPEVLTPTDLQAASLPRRRQAGVALLAGAGVLFLALAGLGALGRAMVHRSVEIDAAAPVEAELVVPAIPSPMLLPPGPPAPLRPSALEDEVEAPLERSSQPPASSPRRRRAPPGFVDVRL